MAREASVSTGFSESFSSSHIFPLDQLLCRTDSTENAYFAGNFSTKAMFTRDRFQMVPIQKSCRIGLLFTRDLLTVPSIRSRSGPKTGPPKKQVQFLEPFRSQTDPSPCKHLDRFLLADPSPCKHPDRFLLVLRRHFESYNVHSAHA